MPGIFSDHREFLKLKQHSQILDGEKFRAYQYCGDFSEESIQSVQSILSKVNTKRDIKISSWESTHSLLNSMRNTPYLIRIGNEVVLLSESDFLNLHEPEYNSVMQFLQNKVAQLEIENTLLKTKNDYQKQKTERMEEKILDKKSTFMAFAGASKIFIKATAGIGREEVTKEGTKKLVKESTKEAIEKCVKKIAENILKEGAEESAKKVSKKCMEVVPFVGLVIGIASGCVRIVQAKERMDYIKAGGEVASGILSMTPAASVGFALDILTFMHDCADTTGKVKEKRDLNTDDMTPEKAAETLGLSVSQSSNKKIVDQAYKHVSRKIHPDKHFSVSVDTNEVLTEAQKIINIARDVLYQYHKFSNEV